MIPLRRGDLRHEITIKTVTAAADGMGGVTETAADHLTGIPAAIWPVSANEQMKADNEKMKITHRIRIDYQSGILPEMTILFGTRTFEIKGVINLEEKNVYLDLLCTEAV
jgi:SPP1 family predicted phage head-tail adaptor